MLFEPAYLFTLFVDMNSIWKHLELSEHWVANSNCADKTNREDTVSAEWGCVNFMDNNMHKLDDGWGQVILTR